MSGEWDSVAHTIEIAIEHVTIIIPSAEAAAAAAEAVSIAPRSVVVSLIPWRVIWTIWEERRVSFVLKVQAAAYL